MLQKSLFFGWRWALTLSMLLTTPALLAKPASKPLTTEQRAAAEHSKVAAAALKAGDAETAVRELSAARKLAPSADILLDLSRALALSGNVLQARDVLKTLLSSYATTLGSRRASVEAELSKVQARIAVLKLNVAEVGASVKLDERELGVTPLTAPVESNPGAHALAVAKPGFLTVSRQLDLRSGSNAVSIALVREKSSGRLVVTSTAEETLELTVNDRNVGPLPVETDLPPGFYRIAATGKKMRTEAQSVRVELGQTTSITLAATLIPGEASVNTGEPGASIYIDDRLVGTGEWHGPIAAGQHSLRVEREGYAPYRQPLDVAPAERVVVGQINFVPLPATKPKDDDSQYEGIFANVALIGLFGTGSTNAIAQDCAANATGGSCTSTLPAGGGLGFRMGYSFGFVALEGLVFGSGDAATANANYEFGTSEVQGDYYGVPREEQYAFVRYGFGVGVGARVTTRHPFLRVTGGLDGVLLRRTVQYVRATVASTVIPDADDHSSESESFFNPGLMADIGILLGSTPGLKFHTGLTLLVEFPPDPVTADGVEGQLGRYMPNQPEPYVTPPLDMTRGPQVSVGPFLAMQFGH